MFQNLNKNEDYVQAENKKTLNIKNLFNQKQIVLYLISFMVSMVSFNGNLAPFGLAIFAACCSNRKPVGVIYALTLIGSAIKFGLAGFVSYLLSSLLFIILILIIRPNFEEEERNEKQKLGIYVFAASFAVQAGKMIFSGFLLYDLITSIALGLITYIFYKIFVNSLIVITEYEEILFFPDRRDYGYVFIGRTCRPEHGHAKSTKVFGQSTLCGQNHVPIGPQSSIA